MGGAFLAGLGGAHPAFADDNAGMNCEKPYCTFALTVLGSAWILLAVFVGETELLRVVPPLAIPATMWSLVALLLLAFWKNKAFRAFVDQLSLRVLIALHVTRFIGFYFLYLASEGELPKRFASAAGWGDILLAGGALVLLAKPSPRWVLGWNILGLADILLVVLKGAMLLLTNREAMATFTTLPLSFLPTFLVPLMIASHVVIFLRLIGPARAVPASSLDAPGPRPIPADA